MKNVNFNLDGIKKRIIFTLAGMSFSIIRSWV